MLPTETCHPPFHSREKVLHLFPGGFPGFSNQCSALIYPCVLQPSLLQLLHPTTSHQLHHTLALAEPKEECRTVVRQFLGGIVSHTPCRYGLERISPSMGAGQTPHTALPWLSWHQPFCGTFVSSLLPAKAPHTTVLLLCRLWLSGTVTHTPGCATAQCAPREKHQCTAPVTTLGDNGPEGPPCSAHDPSQQPSVHPQDVSLSQLGLLCVPRGAGTCCPSRRRCLSGSRTGQR